MLIPASRIADAHYVGFVTDTSELSGVLTEAIQDKHPYLPEKIMQDAISRIQDTQCLKDTYSCTGLVTRYSLEFRQTQRLLSLAIHNAVSDGLFHSLKKKDKLQRARLLSCHESESNDWLRAIPDPKFKTTVSGALWNTTISLRLLIPIDTFCSYCADAGTPVPAEKYGSAVINMAIPEAQYCQRHPCTGCLSQIRNDCHSRAAQSREHSIRSAGPLRPVYRHCLRHYCAFRICICKRCRIFERRPCSNTSP